MCAQRGKPGAQRHSRTHLQPRDQEECQTQRSGMLATVVLGLGLDLGRGNTKKRENLTRVSLNPILPSAMSSVGKAMSLDLT